MTLFTNDTEVHRVCSYRERCKPFKQEPCKQGNVCLIEDKLGTAGCLTSFEKTLGTPCGASGPGYISPDLVGANPVQKSGYDITLNDIGTPGPTDGNGDATTTAYSATALPQTVGTTGQRGFCHRFVKGQ